MNARANQNETKRLMDRATQGVSLDCTEERDGWCCTLPLNHDGDHIATTAKETSLFSLRGDVCYRWPR